MRALLFVVLVGCGAPGIVPGSAPNDCSQCFPACDLSGGVVCASQGPVDCSQCRPDCGEGVRGELYCDDGSLVEECWTSRNAHPVRHVGSECVGVQ
jgi:hypothetical protein